jgi:pimeloyl-ACP methyl ester carboxylesterase
MTVRINRGKHRVAMETARVFIHGLESSSHGTKGIFFRQRYPGMIIEDFDGEFASRMEKLETLLANKNNLVLVGSSYGGLMAAVYACLHEERVGKLILLAPALHLDACKPYLTKKLQIPVVIFHGRQDEVVPLEPVRAIARQLFPNHQFNIVEDDHSLHCTFETFDWETLLRL